MHLETLKLKRFRSCEDLSVTLHPNLTVLVGENNGGKSNIIEAIRLLTLPINGRRERYCEKEDLRRGSTTLDYRIEGHLTCLSPTVKGLLISAVPDPAKDLAVIGIKHDVGGVNGRKGKTTSWAGKFETSEPEVGSTNLIRHIYLPALRDAQFSLSSGSPTRINTLLDHFFEDGEEESFLEQLKRSEKPNRVIGAINEEIKVALLTLTSGVRPQTASLNFSTETVLDIARDLRFKLADSGLSVADIRYSGLGYSNLLYMATVVVELSKAKEADLTLFLVEEPEAHLHPQLQMLVLDFLLAKAKDSAKRVLVSGKPEGRIQIVVTTHSPNLTAWISPDHLVVIRSVKSADPVFTESKAVAIRKLNIKKNAIGKINRYLDVTRSSLLFGNRVLLVEGIAEALLIPAIAKNYVLKSDEPAWLRLQGTAIVPIDGVDFEPFIEILLKTTDGVCIADKVVIITDGDPKVPGDRKLRLERLASSFASTGVLKVFTNEQTLEHSLMSAENQKLLKNVFLALHSNSGADWKEKVEDALETERAKAFLDLLTAKRTRKGDLAQQISARLERSAPFNVPSYIENAIKEITI